MLFELDNGMVLEFFGEGQGTYEYAWEIKQLYAGSLPSKPIEALKTTDNVMQVGEALWAGPATFEATLGDAETVLVSFAGAGDGEEGMGYKARVLSRLEPEPKEETTVEEPAVEEKQYRVTASTQHTGGFIHSEGMLEQEAMQLLRDLEAKINTPSTRAVVIGDVLVMVNEIDYVFLEEEDEE